MSSPHRSGRMIKRTQALERVESTFVGGPRKLCCAQSLKAQKTIYDSAFK